MSKIEETRRSMEHKHSAFKQTKASNITRRTLAVFINAGPNHALRICKIADRLKEDYHAVYSAIRRFRKYGFVKPVKRRIGKRVLSSYILSDKAAALEYMGVSDLASLGEVPRSPFRDWVDLGRAVYEVGATKFRVDGYVCGRIRGYLESLGKIESRDRAKQLSFPCKSFSLVITRHGHVTLWSKGLGWVGDFLDFLVGCGLDEGNRAHVFRKLAEKIDDTQVKVEAPVLRGDVPKVTIETRVGDEKLVSRIASSHYAREIEVSGAFGPVQNFIAALAGSQHFSMLEWVQADKLDRILRVMLLEAKTHERVAEAIESLIGKPAQEREPESKKRRTNYVA